jgi:hypothetical protein
MKLEVTDLSRAASVVDVFAVPTLIQLPHAMVGPTDPDLYPDVMVEVDQAIFLACDRGHRPQYSGCGHGRLFTSTERSV